MVRLSLAVLLSGAALLAGCAGSRPAAFSPSAYPGFDAWRYPGDALMQSWRVASPYVWTGYYLPAPCHRDTSWAGQRETLTRMGWGLAVLYVGQQVFEGAPPPDTTAGTPIICSRTLLTEAQGRADGADAIARARADGFADSTTVFLNIERSTTLPDSMLVYYRAWLETLLRDGRYRPGTYAHRRNADPLFALAQAVYHAAGRSDMPPFWIAGGADFTLEKRPESVGIPYARIWQGALDVDRTWGGSALRIDENVAATPSPSAAPSRQ